MPILTVKQPQANVRTARLQKCFERIFHSSSVPFWMHEVKWISNVCLIVSCHEVSLLTCYPPNKSPSNQIPFLSPFPHFLPQSQILFPQTALFWIVATVLALAPQSCRHSAHGAGGTRKRAKRRPCKLYISSCGATERSTWKNLSQKWAPRKMRITETEISENISPKK